MLGIQKSRTGSASGLRRRQPRRMSQSRRFGLWSKWFGFTWANQILCYGPTCFVEVNVDLDSGTIKRPGFIGSRSIGTGTTNCRLHAGQRPVRPAYSSAPKSLPALAHDFDRHRSHSSLATRFARRSQSGKYRRVHEPDKRVARPVLCVGTDSAPLEQRLSPQGFWVNHKMGVLSADFISNISTNHNKHEALPRDRRHGQFCGCTCRPGTIDSVIW